ncbi:MAG TPA: hypothetical protein V6C71_04155 [Coleofasciculaceae cyanobacterium]
MWSYYLNSTIKLIVLKRKKPSIHWAFQLGICYCEPKVIFIVEISVAPKAIQERKETGKLCDSSSWRSV